MYQNDRRPSIGRFEDCPTDEWLRWAEWSLKRSFYVLGDEVSDKFKDRYRDLAYDLHISLQGLRALYCRKRKYAVRPKKVRNV